MTTTIPGEITAPFIKRLFSEKFGIPISSLAVENANGKGHACVRIKPISVMQLNYAYEFPESLGYACTRIIYKDTLVAQQPWAGNIGKHSIAMLQFQFRQLLEEYFGK